MVAGAGSAGTVKWDLEGERLPRMHEVLSSSLTLQEKKGRAAVREPLYSSTEEVRQEDCCSFEASLG